MDLARRWAAEIDRLMASSRLCAKLGCGRRVVWRTGHDPLRHLAGVCYVCWGERRRDSAGPNRRSGRAWRRVAATSWCRHCDTTVPWAAHWISGQCIVSWEESQAKLATRLPAHACPRGPELAPCPEARRDSLPGSPWSSPEVPNPLTRQRGRHAPSVAPRQAAPTAASSDRIARAEYLASEGVANAWRRADRFAADERNANRVAALILGDDSVRVEDGFVISRVTSAPLAAIGKEVELAVDRRTTN